MSFHRSKLEMNRRLDFRTGEGCLHQEAICFGSEAAVGRLRNQEQLTIIVQMNDQLATEKAAAEAELREALGRISSMSYEASENVSFRPIDLVTEQRDHLFRENQRLLMEL